MYEYPLPTLGLRALPALFGRLQKVAESDDGYLVGQVVGAIASADAEEVGRRAADLLLHPSPRAQRAAMNLLARLPTHGCLDRLWQLHREMQAEKARFLRPGEPETALYHDSFDALRACVRLEPRWLAGAIRSADTAQPVHDLAYLLGNLEGQEAL